MANPDDDQQLVNDPNVDDDTADGSATPALIPKSPALASFASLYEPAQHGTYLRHLREALQEPQKLNSSPGFRVDPATKSLT